MACQGQGCSRQTAGVPDILILIQKRPLPVLVPILKQSISALMLAATDNEGFLIIMSDACPQRHGPETPHRG